MYKNKYKVLILFSCLLLLAFISFDYAAIAEAADKVTALQPSADNKILQEGTGLKTFDYGTNNNNDGTNGSVGFVDFVKGILSLTRPIVTILTAVAGLQMAFGISDGKKTVWNWILGVGLALSFAGFAFDSGIFDFAYRGKVGDYNYTLDTSKIDLHITNKPQDNKDFLSDFMGFFKEGIIQPGAKAIQPICTRLLLILFTINCSMKLALDLISGDKIKFLVTETIKAGFYLFLIINWVNGWGLTGLLSNGFQEIGFRAGGETDKFSLSPDSIWNNGIMLLSAMLHNLIENASVFDMTNTLLMVITFVVSCFCIIMTSLEMFMVRIEFLTMALLTMPLLAFGVIEQFSFLTQKAIGAVFNLAMKCCVIAFIQAICNPFFQHLVGNLVTTKNAAAKISGKIWNGEAVVLNEKLFSSPGETFMSYLTVILGLFIIYMLTKKIPALVSGLLSGQPQLAGNDMASMAMGTVTGAATAVGVLSGIPGGGKGGGAPGGNTPSPSPSPGGTSGGDDASTTLSNLTTSVGKAGAQIAAGVATGGASAGATAAGTMAKTGAGAASAGAGAAAQGGGAAGGSTIGGAGANGAGSMQGAAGGGASTGSGGMPDTGSSKLPDFNTGKRDEDKNDAPDTSVNAPVDTGDDPYHKKYDQEGEGDSQAQEAPPQEAQAQQQASQQPPNGGGPNGQAQQPPQQGGGGSGSYSQSSSGGSVAGYLAKAALMSSPAGNVVDAFGKGRNLANNFDRAIHGDTKEQESQSAKLDQLIYMISQQHYDDPPGGGGNGNNNKDMRRL